MKAIKLDNGDYGIFDNENVIVMRVYKREKDPEGMAVAWAETIASVFRDLDSLEKKAGP